MAKKNKLKTPNWILKGEEKSQEKKIGKTFKIKRCPKCSSEDVGVVIGESQKAEPLAHSSKRGQTNGIWECKKCGWKGREVKGKELTEEEFMKYLDEKGEEVA